MLPPNKITDYLIRVVQPQLQAVEGVQLAEFIGGKRFAVRVWLKPDKLAAYGLTATDVSTALGNNDYLSAVGQHQGPDGPGQLTGFDQSQVGRRVSQPDRQAKQRRLRAACPTSPMSRWAPKTTIPR